MKSFIQQVLYNKIGEKLPSSMKEKNNFSKHLQIQLQLQLSDNLKIVKEDKIEIKDSLKGNSENESRENTFQKENKNSNNKKKQEKGKIKKASNSNSNTKTHSPYKITKDPQMVNLTQKRTHSVKRNLSDIFSKLSLIETANSVDGGSY